MMWDGFRAPKPKTKFNGDQDMTGVDKVPIVATETEADRIANKLARTREIVTDAQTAAQEFATRAKCDDCVWKTIVADRYTSGKTHQRCRQPLVSGMYVEQGTTKYANEVYTTEARDEKGVCGVRGDLFVEKTWWEKHGEGIVGSAAVAAIIAIIIGVFGVLIHFFGLSNVLWTAGILGFIGFVLTGLLST